MEQWSDLLSEDSLSRAGHARAQARGEWTSTAPDNWGRKPGRGSGNHTPWNRGWKTTTFSR